MHLLLLSSSFSCQPEPSEREPLAARVDFGRLEIFFFNQTSDSFSARQDVSGTSKPFFRSQDLSTDT